VESYSIDYEAVLASAGRVETEDLITYLNDELPWQWRDAYERMTVRQIEVCRVLSESFVYLFDDYSTLEARGIVPQDPSQESRLVAAYGRSNPRPRKRDDSRLRGWVGRTEAIFGREWDKGHYIGHSIGGAVDGIEANVFVQRRDLNRGWSVQGKRFRLMEDHCCRHPSSFCFSRPIYDDGMSRPAAIEFGLLNLDNTIWAERFDNRS